MSLPVQDMASEQGPGQDGFCPAASNSVWYENLERSGSCKRLLELLTEDRTWIHELGYEDMTVLHKGVQHGCVALVRFVLVEMFDDRGHCKCGRHGAGAPALTREQLLRKTCSYGSTAVNMAVVSGSPKMVVLLEWAIEMCSRLSEQSTRDRAIKHSFNERHYRDAHTIRSSYVKKRGREEEIHAESTSHMNHGFPVPDVKDDDLSILTYRSNSEVERKVISVIEGVLEDPGDEHREWMDMVKEWVAKDVDFEFVPLAHVFLHFLCSVDNFSFREREFIFFREGVTKRILEACSADGEDGESGAMLTTLFNILDPRGRPLLHVAYESLDSLWLEAIITSMSSILDRLGDISLSIKAEICSTRDGAGRSIFHLMAIHDERYSDPIDFMVQSHAGRMVWSDCVQSPQDEKLGVLKKWCFPLERNDFETGLTPVQLALLLSSGRFLAEIWPSDGSRGLVTHPVGAGNTAYGIQDYFPLQLAAALGRAAMIEDMLKRHIKFGSLEDLGLGHGTSIGLLAIHYAAAYGQVEAIQSILKFPVYDPMVQHWQVGSALHVLLDKQHFMVKTANYHDVLLCYVLPNFWRYEDVKDVLFNLCSQRDDTPRMYSSNEINCINLLFKASIDIWTPHVGTNELPSPGCMANNATRKWWFEKVVREVVVLKTNVSYAANATSMVAGLVAMASFIGPFQPPLGYGDEDGFICTDRSPLRVYLVCNSLSFYFSIASILMSLLPVIPMPKESVYEELLRSQRCLKGAALMFLISIITILISFSSASMAVVSPKWHERQVVVSCVIFGGAICVVVLVIYIIRLLRMLFHRNDRFRRMFARYMYF